MKSGWNTQLSSAGTLQNQFVVLVNSADKEVVFSFKGSDAASNWKSDLTDAGAAEFAKIWPKAQAALAALEADPQYSGWTFFAAGHSLGGGMAQTFAVKNGLDAY